MSKVCLCYMRCYEWRLPKHQPSEHKALLTVVFAGIHILIQCIFIKKVRPFA